MSEPSSTDPGKPVADLGKPVAPKKGVSPLRNAIGLVILVAVLAAGWFQLSARNQFNAAVDRLNARAQDEEKDLMTVQEAEDLLGKSPDGPASDVTEGNRGFTKKTYTWHGLKHYTLTAFYTKENDPRLHHYETEGAQFEPEKPAQSTVPLAASSPGPAQPPGPGSSKGAGRGHDRKAAAEHAKKSAAEPAKESAPEHAKTPAPEHAQPSAPEPAQTPAPKLPTPPAPEPAQTPA